MPVARAAYAASRDIRQSITSYPWTRNLRHILPVTFKQKRAHKGEPAFRNVVDAKDRIKYWNIVPGDKIRVLGLEDTVHDVALISKYRNRVWIQNEDGGSDQDNKKNYAYSRCQLYMGDYEFPSKTPGAEPVSLPVFAKRISMSAPKYSPQAHRFVWTRFAMKTTPVIQHLKGRKIPIPWPKYVLPTNPDSQYDTEPEVVQQVTYVLPTVTSSHVEGPRPNEMEFLRSVYNAGYNYTYGGVEPPAEIFLTAELSNPHSSAKKHSRWLDRKAHDKALMKEYIDAELATSGSRTKTEATADAMWKWKERLAVDRKERLVARQMKSGAFARVEKRNMRKARKAKQQRERLTNLTLEKEENQFVPEL